MNLKEALRLQEEAHKTKIEIRKKKGSDYAKPDADIHANFRVMADLEKVLKKHGYRIPIDRPEGVAFWHMLHKFIRILNLWNRQVKPENESLDDTHFDLENYSELAREIYIDEHKKDEQNDK